MRRPLDTAAPVPQTRDALAKLLVDFGVSILKTVCQPEVLTVFRLAIAESDLSSTARSTSGLPKNLLLVSLRYLAIASLDLNRAFVLVCH